MRRWPVGEKNFTRSLHRNMGSGEDTMFEKYVGMLPVSSDKLVGSAISWFLMKQDPEDVSLDLYNNGYQITVKTDKDNVKEMAEFWEEYVSGMLGDDNE